MAVFTVDASPGEHATYDAAKACATAASLAWCGPAIVRLDGEPFAIVNAVSGRSLIGLRGLSIFDGDGSLRHYYRLD